MKHNVLKEEVDQILSQAFWNKGGIKLNENAAPEAAETVEQPADEAPVEAVNEEAHVCPLCESHLEAPISDDKLSEHIDLMIDIIDEMVQLTEGDDSEDDGEELAEESHEDDEDAEQVVEKKGLPAFLKGKMNKKSSKASSSTKGPEMK
jgi:transcription elongation factor Elf1